MTDRLYCVENGQFAVYDFEAREVRFTEEDPHPNGKDLELPPFKLDATTFWAIVGRISQLDELNHVHVHRRGILPP